MSLSFLETWFPHPRLSLLLYAATWTGLLTVTVAVASFSPELAFVAAINPSSSLSKTYCVEEGSVRLPLDIPSANFCIPARLFKRSKMDVIIPPVFAAVVVASSALMVKALGLWEFDDDDLN